MKNRPGFTMVEILIVVLIIGLLISITVPAVNAVRRNARRTDCLNRLRQLGQAVQSYEGAHNRYPGWLDILRSGSATKVVPWTVMILPELDRRDLYDAVRDAASPALGKVDLFICPSDTDKAALPRPLSYVANAGMPDVSGSSPPDVAANGIFHNRTIQRPVRVHARYVMQGDGLALTLLLSENLAAPSYWEPTPLPEYALGMVFLHPVPSDSRARINGSEERITSGMPAAQAYLLARPSSFHLGGVNVVFANGNGRFLSDRIDYAVYRELMTPNGAKAYDVQAGSSLGSLHFRITQEQLEP